MIAIICAMYYEARAFIEHYGLKKISSGTRFQIFSDTDIVLAVCGVGNMNAAVCTAHILTAYKIDLLVNIGICAASDINMKIGAVCICNKISSDTGSFFYPDILYKHDLLEAEIFSSFKPYVKSNFSHKRCLYDMESFGIMEAAYIFLMPNQAAVIKIISDHGDTAHVTPDFVYKLTADNCGKIIKIIEAAKDFNSACKPISLSEGDMRTINDLCGHFRFTAAMENEIIKYAKLYKLKNNCSIDFLQSCMSVNTKTKNERKAVFDEIKRKLTQRC